MAVQKQTVPKIIGGILITIFVIGWLGGCVLFGTSMCSYQEETNPGSNEYVGVWAAYEVKADNKEYYADSIDDVHEFLVLHQNGSAQDVVSIANDEPFVVECSWIRTTRDKKEGTNAGILLLGDSFENPYQYFLSPEKGESYLIDAPIIGGFLCIDYGDRKVYMEKISDDPDDKPWLNRKGASASSSTSKSGRAASAKTIPEGAIDWSKASQYVGKTATFYGKVVDAEYASSSNSSPTFLDLGAAYPDSSRLSIVIWGKNRSKFSSAPESLYKGKTIAVTGEVYKYDGVCNIEVSSPSQIVVID